MRLQILIGLLLLVIGIAVGRYTLPTKVVTKTVIDTHTVTVVQHDVQTVEVDKPDGTKTVVTTDKSVDTTKSKTDESQTKVTENYKPQWKAAVQFSSSSNLPDYLYGVTLEKRILGPIFIGGFGNANRQFGVSLGVEL